MKRIIDYDYVSSSMNSKTVQTLLYAFMASFYYEIQLYPEVTYEVTHKNKTLSEHNFFLKSEKLPEIRQACSAM